MEGAWSVTAGHDVFFSVFDLNFPPLNFDFDPDENFGRQLNDLFSKCYLVYWTRILRLSYLAYKNVNYKPYRLYRLLRSVKSDIS